jgi:hypothetical protein
MNLSRPSPPLPPGTRSPVSRELPGRVALGALALLSVLLAWHRLHFGIDVSDESLYVAMADRFARGDRPFVDELQLVQSAALLTGPLVRLYLWLNGGPDGLVLFTRTAYLVFTCGVACCVLAGLRRMVPWTVAVPTALAAVAFTPYNIFNLSYNTLGCGFLTAGLFCGLRVYQGKHHIPWAFASGTALGLAVVAYPPLLVPAAAYILVGAALLARRVPSAALAWLGGSLLIGVAVLPILLGPGPDNLGDCISYMRSLGVHGGGIRKLVTMARGFVGYCPNLPAVLGLAALILVTGRSRPGLCRWFLLLLPLAFFPLQPASTSSLQFLDYWILLAPCLLPFVRNQQQARVLLLAVWLPSALGGAITAWTSASGYRNAAVGGFAAALVSTVLWGFALQELHRRSDRSASMKPGPAFLRVQWLPPVLVLAVLLCFQLAGRGLYLDDPLPQLRSRVDAGPFRGLYTTRWKKEYLATFSEDLARVERPGRSVLIYNEFSAGYLLTRMRPAARTVWVLSLQHYPRQKRSLLVEYCSSRRPPDVVVRMKTTPYRTTLCVPVVYPPDDVLDRFIRTGPYTPVLVRDGYTIYLRARSDGARSISRATRIGPLP